ncbi:transaldolase family protein [Bacillus thuringiensis]|uniref:transaldolase family protein n=1 Tax=Bacillus thuringiensis TaxID=1428 RepID=UPI00333735DB
MKIFLDTSIEAEINKLLPLGFIDGVTTNPSIMVKEGNKDIVTTSKRIIQLVHPLPVSIEVCSSEPEEMLRQARMFASWGNNVVVKITVITENGSPCFGVIKTLEEEGIKVNCTACMSFNQAVLAAKAGATYISLLVGRINDEGNDGFNVVKNTKEWLTKWGYKSEIIAASIRNPIDIQEAALAGTDIITIPPNLISKMYDHQYSRSTVEGFVKDGQLLLDSLYTYA